MAKNESFDITSTVDMQEVDNAINQTNKEIRQRFDFKKSIAAASQEDGNIKIVGEDDFRIRSVVDILETKLIRREVAVKNLDFGKVTDASGGNVQQIVTIKQGIDKETAKKMVKDIKGLKLKVQAQIMEDQIRVSGKKRDDLQEVISFLKTQDYNQELRFTNYR